MMNDECRKEKMMQGEKFHDCLKVLLVALAIQSSSFIIRNSAYADSLKSGLAAAERAAATTAAAAEDTKVAKAVAALVEDDFDDDAAKAAALKVVRNALGAADGNVAGDDAGHLRQYLYHCAAGIQPGFKGGWDIFELYPQPQEWLKWIDAEKDLPQGKIKSSWKYEDGKCMWSFTIPEGTKATVCVNGMCKRYTPGEYKLEIRQ